MFFRGSIVFRVLAALLLVAVLVGAGVWLYRAGFAEGYAQAAPVAGEDTRPAVPGYPYYPWIGRPYFGFFPGFSLFGIFFFGLFFLFILRWLFRPWRWSYPGRWHEHPHPWDRPAEAETGERRQPSAAEGDQK